MAGNSHIEWTEATWNPVTGCTKLSEGCRHCYAERMTRRLQAMGNLNYRDGFDVVRCHEHMLSVPSGWTKPRKIFVNSMSDLFHRDVPEEFIRRVFATMEETPRHVYQVLTKRSERMAKMDLRWPEHVWAGVTIEHDRYRSRLDDLKSTRAAVRFLSLEPLLGPLEGLDLHGIDWVIVGGESGPGARPLDESWALSLRDQCLEQGVPFFFKQWGGVNRVKTGRVLDGRVWSELPRAMVAV